MSNHQKRKAALSLEVLTKAIASFSWHDFERLRSGDLDLIFHEAPNSPMVIYQMRVGLHMRLPIQAIMAEGYFIRTRSAQQYARNRLLKLDPRWPHQCLYCGSFWCPNLEVIEHYGSQITTLKTPGEVMFDGNAEIRSAPKGLFT